MTRLARTVLPIGVLAVSMGCKRPEPPPDLETPHADSPPPAPAPVRTPRCTALPAPPFVLGEQGDAAAEEDSLPFAAEVGEAVAYAGGFAIGAIREGSRASSAVVVTLSPEGKDGTVIGLGSAHGDVDPPRLAARGNTLVAAIAEPQPNGRSIRLAKIDGGAVTWGAAVHEARDESQAYDLALGEKKGLLVWDEDGPKGGVILASTFDAQTATAATTPRPLTTAPTDAETPRLVERPGGWWLAYVARRAASDDLDARFVAEEIGFRWIEVAPLDANGSPSGAARAVTSRDGHVIAFDVAPGQDGGVNVVYRDDDTPSGSSGGRVMRVLIHPSSVEQPTVFAEDGVGAGAPNLLPGWLAVADAAEATRLAPLSASGDLAGALEAEPLLGPGEPLAVRGDALLVARPQGRAVKLFVARCVAPIIADR